MAGIRRRTCALGPAPDALHAPCGPGRAPSGDRSGHGQPDPRRGPPGGRDRVRRAAGRLPDHGHAAADVCHACLAPLAEAAALYRDHFLAGFTLRDSAEFDDWQFTQAETLRGELGEALEKLAGGQSARGDFAGAVVSARRWLASDPLREEAHRQVMRLYAWADQRNAALRQYRECVRILEQELGVAPLAETTELYEAVKGNRLSPPADLAAPEKPDRSKPDPDTDLAGDQKPARVLPLVGRGAEVTTLIRAYERHGAGGYFVGLEGGGGHRQDAAGGGIFGPGSGARRNDHHGALLRRRSQRGLRPRGRWPAGCAGSARVRRPAGCTPRSLAG